MPPSDPGLAELRPSLELGLLVILESPELPPELPPGDWAVFAAEESPSELPLKLPVGPPREPPSDPPGKPPSWPLVDVVVLPVLLAGPERLSLDRRAPDGDALALAVLDPGNGPCV